MPTNAAVGLLLSLRTWAECARVVLDPAAWIAKRDRPVRVFLAQPRRQEHVRRSDSQLVVDVCVGHSREGERDERNDEGYPSHTALDAGLSRASPPRAARLDRSLGRDVLPEDSKRCLLRTAGRREHRRLEGDHLVALGDESAHARMALVLTEQGHTAFLQLLANLESARAVPAGARHLVPDLLEGGVELVVFLDEFGRPAGAGAVEDER